MYNLDDFDYYIVLIGLTIYKINLKRNELSIYDYESNSYDRINKKKDYETNN